MGEKSRKTVPAEVIVPDGRDVASDKKEPLLSVRGVDKSFGSRSRRTQVLFNVDMDVAEGECLAVIGGSGSGKTTLTRIAFGLEQTDSGTVTYRGVALSGVRSLGMLRLRNESGLVFQNPFTSLDPRWTAGESMAEGLIARQAGHRAGDAGRRAASDDIAGAVRRALGMVGLDPDEFIGRYPVDMSGGQAQRVAIARAIVAEPRIVLADEPMSAVDVSGRVQILDALAEIRRKRPRTAMVIVSHDLGVVQHIADRIVVLHDGRIEETAATGDLLTQPQSAYTKQLIDAAAW